MTIANDKLVNEVEAIARKAGAAILEIYARDFSIEEKEDKSPLTEADSGAHNIIIEALAALTPKVPILSEEAVEEFRGADVNGCYWLVDPLDGTKEFIRRNGEFTVNIALIENGCSVLGVVYAPVPDVAYLAASGIGAFKKSKGEARKAIVVDERADGVSWRIVGSRSHAGDSLGMLLAHLSPHQLVSMGSSLKFCLVAEGSADVYPRLGLTSLWDTAAAQCVVEQAGGAVIQLNGKPLSYANPSVTLNPFFIVHGKSAVNWRDLAAAASV